jgi:hypothetical protein
MTHIQQRRDQAAVWTAENPVLFDGEMGHESDTGRSKLGDGATAWNSLPYKSDVDSVAGKTGAVTLVVADVSGAAPLASPALTGNPTAPTPMTADNDTSIATTAFVKAQAYAPLASPALTGNPTAPTPDVSDDDTSIATTAFVRDVLGDSPALGGNPTAPTPSVGDDDTSIATTAHVKDVLDTIAHGVLGYAQVVASQTGITTEVDLTGLSVAVTAGTSRRIRISYALRTVGSAISSTVGVTIKEGGTALQEGFILNNAGAGIPQNGSDSIVITPSAGAHTYKLTMALAAGSGTVDLHATAARVAYILVEDIGPA